jgi:predicted signal transduction protein with EAL and GGDEF domain
VSEAAFLENLRSCIGKRRASGRELAVMLIDTGVIADIDALWGYHAGDAVRDRISAALRSEVLRPEDPLDELGRGTLACALTAVDDPALALLAAEKSLRLLSTPFLIGDDEVYARAAIGIAVWPTHGDDPETLVQCAQAGSIQARTDPSHVALYDHDRVDSSATRFLFENRLRSAVTDETLDLVFQPQYDLRLGNVMGAESLLQSRDPRIGLVSATDAFAAAEAAGIAGALVSSLLNRALRNCSEFRHRAGLNPRIGVNITARVLAQAELPDLVERALRTWNLGAGRLVLEIADVSALIADAGARETLGRLRELGVRLSVDDPQLTVASLFEMAALPFQEIKLEVSALSVTDPAARPLRIVQSLVELAHHLDLSVVAVGVAGEAAADRLKEIGCDYAQSDHKNPPVDAAEFVRRYGLV